MDRVSFTLQVVQPGRQREVLPVMLSVSVRGVALDGVLLPIIRVSVKPQKICLFMENETRFLPLSNPLPPSKREAIQQALEVALSSSRHTGTIPPELQALRGQG